MPATITSIIESLLNPQDRFRTLKRIAPVTDSYGVPIFSISADSADFDVTADGVRYLLRVPMGWSEDKRIEASHDAVRTVSIPCGCIAQCGFLKNELTTFDARGRLAKNDVIMEKIPDGALPLHSFLRSDINTANRRRIRGLLESIEKAHLCLNGAGISHGHIRPESFMVTADNTPLLLHYLHTHDRIPEKDLFSLIYISLIIFVSTCEPRLHRVIWQSSRTGKDTLLRNIMLEAEFSRNAELTSIVKMLQHPQTISPEATKTALHSISMMHFAPMPLLASLTDDMYGISVKIEQAKDISATYGSGGDISLTVEFSGCDFVGSLSDMLVRYRKGDAWGFADRHGNKSGEAVYSWADDFYEGRAAVRTDGKYGLIDRDGGYVIPPVHENLEWYGEYNIAAASAEGKWKLYDRCGAELTAAGYDWMGEPSECMILVRRGQKYGFLTTEGKPATELRFDEAFSFEGGTALVSQNGNRYHIDRDGKKTDDR